MGQGVSRMGRASRHAERKHRGAPTPPEEFPLALPTRTVYVETLPVHDTLDCQGLRPVEQFLLF